MSAGIVEELSMEIPRSIQLLMTAMLGALLCASPAHAEVAEPPVNVESPTIAGQPVKGMLLTASQGRWESTQAVTLTTHWYRCDAAGSACSDMPVASGLSYHPAPNDVGSKLRVRVAAMSAAGQTVALSAMTAVVTMPPPRNTTAPSLSGGTTQGATLTSSLGVWSSEVAPAYSRQWQRCDETLGTCTNIEGATAATYRSGVQDVGMRVRAVVRAQAQGVAATAASRASSAITVPAPLVQPLPRFTLDTAVVATWMAPAGASAASYEVDVAAAPSGPWTTTATTGTVHALHIDRGATACVRVRTRNVADAVSASSTATCTTAVLDDNALTAGGMWNTDSDISLLGGSARRTGAIGSSLIMSASNVRTIRIVATTCPTCGSVRITWNGNVQATINLASSATRRRVLVGNVTFIAPRSGTVGIVVASSGRPVVIDGIALA
jgi:hypothetical protein